MPFSNDDRAGFENKLAEIVARDLGAELQYAWWAERKSFVRNSLAAGRCDLLLGVPSTLDSVLTTHPYYRSTYVFVARRDRGLKITSLADERLASLRIGVHVVGDDYAPPAHALAQRGLSAQLVGYSLFGEYGEANPPGKLVEAVSRGDVDVAIVWGPYAGYFAGQAGRALEIEPVTPPVWMGIPFRYEISMAVRKEDAALKDELDRVLARECPVIRTLLAQYRIPEDGPKCDASPLQSSASSR